MIELWLVSIKNSKYTYRFSILGLKGNITLDKSLGEKERYDTIILSNLSGYYENDTEEQMNIKFKLMRAIEKGNYEEYILRMTH